MGAIKKEDHPPEFVAWLAPVLARLREEREKHGLTFRGVEEATGIPFASVSRVEAGRHVPSLPFLFALAKGYGVSVESLLCGCEPADAKKGKR